ncbi:hypothetical protein ACP70R_021695 [Stipagrostis hirtigluma subsp. patula]
MAGNRIVVALADLHGLVDVDGPGTIELSVLDFVSNADAYLAVVDLRMAEGWQCPLLPQLRTAAKFAALLTRVRDEVLPVLRADPADVQALRSLRNRGNKIQKIHKHPTLGPPQIVDEAGTLGNRLTRVAREVLKGRKSVATFSESLDDIENHVARCLQDSAVFDPVEGLGVEEAEEGAPSVDSGEAKSGASTVGSEDAEGGAPSADDDGEEVSDK